MKRLALLCCYWLMILAVFSMSSYGLRLSQIEFDLSLPGGATETGTFFVINDEEESTTVDISLADWDRAIDGENRFMEVGSIARSASEWINVAPTQFTLEPGESQEVRFTIAVPTGIQGTFWSALIVEGTPREVEAESGATILVRKRFAVKILETPPGSGSPSGQINGLTVTGLNPLTAVVEFENTGLVNLSSVKGRVEVRNTAGEVLESIVVEDFPVLPGAVRLVQVPSTRELGEVFEPGRYLILSILDFGGDNLLGGQFVLDIEPLDIVPIGTSSDAPRDLDGDGFYEDINGDGVFDSDDIVFFDINLLESAIQANTRAFDFDNDGDVDSDDIVTLEDIFNEPVEEEA